MEYNATYNELSVTPISGDETYSRLRMTQNKVRPSDDLTRRGDINQNTIKGVKQTSTKEATSSTKVTTAVIITVIAMLLILMLISIVLSVAIFSRLTSEQSKVASQLDNQNDSEDIRIQLTQIQNNISQLNDRVNDFISTQFSPSQCGTGLWWRVAYLNMTEPLQQCPSAWREYNTSGVRACGRPVNETGSCAAVFYFTKHQYSRVCGRIIGYQVASPDAFKKINKKFYGRGLDGVTVTHRAQQDHIWSFAAGVTERGSHYRSHNCPCSPAAGPQPPENIGDSYFCESGNPNNGFEDGRLYSSDRLWDGQECEGSCCEGTQSPPWFSVQLPAPTTDIIEVSICCEQSTTDEDTPVELIEIYMQ